MFVQITYQKVKIELKKSENLKILLNKMKFKVLLVIPARFNSTRLPGKPWKKLEIKLIQRVYRKNKNKLSK